MGGLCRGSLGKRQLVLGHGLKNLTRIQVLALMSIVKYVLAKFKRGGELNTSKHSPNCLENE